MSLFGQTKRYTPSKPRRSPLPIFLGDPEKKFGLSNGGQSRWYTILYIPLPLFSRSCSSESLLNSNNYASPQKGHSRQRRYIRFCLPIPPRLYGHSPLRFILSILLLVAFGLFLAGFRKSRDGRNTWSPPFVDPNTLILSSEELAMIWEWEILSGHYPSIQQRELLHSHNKHL